MNYCLRLIRIVSLFFKCLLEKSISSKLYFIKLNMFKSLSIAGVSEEMVVVALCRAGGSANQLF